MFLMMFAFRVSIYITKIIICYSLRIVKKMIAVFYLRFLCPCGANFDLKTVVIQRKIWYTDRVKAVKK